MKFLCVPCDEPMLLQEALGPDGGSMSIVYRCPACHRDIAMLTNKMETQMVRSLGVKIGGQMGEAQPMEMLRASLTGQKAEANPTSGSRCPFTGVVAAAYETSDTPAWTAEAEERIAAIPSFVQPAVRKQVAEYARERGYAEITAKVMDEVKGRLGM